MQNKIYLDNINELVVAQFCDSTNGNFEVISNCILLTVVITSFLARIFPKFRHKATPNGP